MYNRNQTLRVLILAMALAPAVAPAQPERLESLIAAGKFTEARPLITQQLEAAPDDPYLLYNLALTYYAAGDHEEAVVVWEKVRMARDAHLVTKAMAQIGNASYRISEKIKQEGRGEDATIQLRRAHHSLQAAVGRDGDYEIARKNYEYVSQKLVGHLVQQGNAKIAQTEVSYVRGESDLVLFRSALTDYEEAQSIRPDDEKIRQLVEDTRQKMTDYLKESGRQNLEAARKNLEKVTEPGIDDRLDRNENRNLAAAEDALAEAVANFEDAVAISPDDQETQETAEEGAEEASRLMKDIADMWRKNSEANEQLAEQKQEQRDEVSQQQKSEENKARRRELFNESKDLAREIHRHNHVADSHQERALEDYERALAFDPNNMDALAALEQLQQKRSEELEASADENLDVADRAQQNVENRVEPMAKLLEEIASADEKRANQLQAKYDQYEQQNAASAQHAANELLEAKGKLEEATQLDPDNESAAQKLAETTERISDVLAQAGDMQMAAAEQHLEAGNEDQAIAHMEQAIKDFDTAAVLSQDPETQEAMGAKMEAARQELLAQRNERAQELAAQQRLAAQQQQAPTDPAQAQNQPQQNAPDGQNQQEQAAEYTEMVQFAEEGSSEDFGKFDTQAMRRAVKDW